MADNVEIKVGFDLDLANFEEQIQKLQKELESADIGKGVDAQLLNKVRVLKTEVNKFAQSLNDTQKGSEQIKNLYNRVSELDNVYKRVRDSMVAVTQEMKVQEKAASKNKSSEQIQQEQADRLRLEQEKKKALDIERQEALNLADTKTHAMLQELDIQERINKARSEGIAAERGIPQQVQQLEQVQQAQSQVNEENYKERVAYETKAHTQGLFNLRKKRSIIHSMITTFYNTAVKYTKLWSGILGSAFSTVANGFKTLLSNIFNRTGSQAANLLSNLKGLLGIAGGLGLYKLGSEAIETSNEFKTLGSTSQIIARQMSDAFYEAAGDSYNSLVKLSNGTEQVTDTLRKFINTWTGQVSLMKAQLTAIGANIGNLLTKVFYPLLVVLNKVLAVVNMLIGKLASLFGFNTAKLGDILGNVGGAKAQNKGLDDYTKSANKASKATKKLADNTKKAKDNLQGYDKLNNTTTDDLDDLTDKMDDIASGGLDDIGGIFDTDKLFDNLMDELDLVPEWMKKWIDELLDLIKAGDWYKVGAHIGDLVNLGLNKLAEFLSDPSLPQKIDKLTDSLTKFANGVLDTVDWKLLGIDISKGLNLITYSIDSLYKSAIKNKTLDKIGDALHDTFMGFIHTIDAEQAGRAAVSAMRAIVDVVFKALDGVKDYEVNAIADRIRDFVTGAFDRLTGLNEGELKSGAQKVGEIIAKVINIGLQTVSYLINADTAKSLATAISDLLNSAIQNLDEERMKSALSGMLQFMGTLLKQLAEDVDVDEFVTKVLNTINNSIENGDVTTFVAGLTTFINKFFDIVRRIIKELDWAKLKDAILEGIEEGGGIDTAIGNFAEFVIVPALFAALIKGFSSAAEWALVGAALKGGMGATLGTLFKGGGIAGGAIGTILGLFDSITKGVNEANAAATILSATLLGFSIGGPIGGVIGALGAGITELVTAFIQDADGVRTKTEELISYLGLKFKEIPQQAKLNLLSFVDAVQFNFNRAMQVIGPILNTGVQLVRQGVSNIVRTVTTTLSNFVKTAYNLGLNVVKGIANGIGSGIKWVQEKIDNIVQTIQNRFSRGMSIHSPSKVMEDLAIFVPEGVAQGIEDGQGSIDDAMSDMITSMKFSDFYTDAYNQTDSFVDDVTARLQDITTPELDPLQYQSNITRNPSQTASMIAQSYSESSATKASSMMSGIYNRIVAGVGQTGGRNVIVDVYLDKNNKLGQYVIDTMKGNVVMTGGV
jgi:hypothetical protein